MATWELPPDFRWSGPDEEEVDRAVAYETSPEVVARRRRAWAAVKAEVEEKRAALEAAWATAPKPAPKPAAPRAAYAVRGPVPLSLVRVDDTAAAAKRPRAPDGEGTKRVKKKKTKSKTR